MELSRRASNAAPPLLFTFAQEARSRAASGVDLLSMEQGQLDFPTPSNVVRAAQEFLDQGQVLYTNVDGIPELKEAVRVKLKRDNDLVYGTEEIFVGAGASQIIFNAFAVSLNDGDEVIVPQPAWTVFSLGIVANEGRVVAVDTHFDEGFKITPAALERAITDRTRWLILNSPSNPSGAVYSLKELGSLADVLRRHTHVSVLSDDLYEHQVFDGADFVNILNAAPDLRDRVLVVNGVAKTYGMTGWRIGYCAGPASFLEAMKWYQAPATSSPSHVSQVAAVEALTGPDSYLAERRAALQQRRDILVDGLSEIDGWFARRSEGAFYVYAGCSGLIGAKTRDGTVLHNDIDVAHYLLAEANVVAVPGAAFGSSPFIRFSFGTATNRIEKAIALISSATANLETVGQ